VLKAKYYPNGGLKDIVFSGNASSSWTTIPYGLKLLKKRLVWRVHNGQSIRIWKDPWIPRPVSYRLVSTKGRCRPRFVSELIDITKMDIAKIMRLKLSPRLSVDQLSWTPRSMYYLL
jgi:hypothetical protein